MIGNSVSPVIAKALLQRIANALGESSRKRLAMAAE